MIHQVYKINKNSHLSLHWMLKRWRVYGDKSHLVAEPSFSATPLRQAPAQDYSPFEVFGCRRAFWIVSR